MQYIYNVFQLCEIIYLTLLLVKEHDIQSTCLNSNLTAGVYVIILIIGLSLLLTKCT